MKFWGVGGEPVVFGVAAPLNEAYGQTTRMGAELAAREINAKGGIRGDSLVLVFKDDRADENQAVLVAEEFVLMPEVVAVVGHVTSGATEKAAVKYQQGLAALATSATSSKISRLGEWIFRIAPSDSSNAVALARKARELGDRTAVLYANDDSYGREMARQFSDAYRAAGGALVDVDPYLEDMENFAPYIRRLQAQGTSLVVMAGMDQGAARMIAQAREIGFGARFMGGDGLEALVDRGPLFDGTFIGMLYHEDASPAAKRFAQSFRAAYNREPDSSAATAYDAVMLLAEAAKAGNRTRPAIRGYLERVGRPGGVAAFEGVTGPIAFDANGDPKDKPFVITEARNGRFALLESAD